MLSGGLRGVYDCFYFNFIVYNSNCCWPRRCRKSGMKKEGGENVIKSVYIYLVLFATLMMTIGGSIGAFMALADFIAPTPYYQTFEEYSAIQDKERARDDGQAANLSGEELRKRYEETVVSYS